MQVNIEMLNALKNLLSMPQRDLGKEIEEKMFILELGIEQVSYLEYSTSAVGCRGLPYEEWVAQRDKYNKEPFKIMVTKIADIDKYEKHINEWNQEMYRDMTRLNFRDIKTLFEEIKDCRRRLEGASGHMERAMDKFNNDMYVASTGKTFHTLETITQRMNGVIKNYEERTFSLHNFKNWVLPIFGYPAFEPISFGKANNLKAVNEIGEHQEGNKYFVKSKVSTKSTFFDWLGIDFEIDGETVFITTLLLENIKKIIRIRKYVVIDLLEKITGYLRLHGEFEEPAPNTQNSQELPPATGQPTNTIEFDNTTLTQIINDDMINLFLKHEQRLKADGYITSENKWIKGWGKNQTKSLKDLANLILLLKEKKYLKSEFERKKLKDRNYKQFFEARYGCNLKDQFNEAVRDKTKSLETAKITFIWF